MGTVAEDRPLSLPGLPLDGLTRERARLVRETLCGYPVRFWSVNDPSPDGVLGVFTTIRLAGDWDWNGAFAGEFEIVIATDWGDNDRYGPSCGSGLSRILGPGALARLDVLAPDPWDVCEDCGYWRPRLALVDVDHWFFNDRERPGLRCREHR